MDRWSNGRRSWFADRHDMFEHHSVFVISSLVLQSSHTVPFVGLIQLPSMGHIVFLVSCCTHQKVCLAPKRGCTHESIQIVCLVREDWKKFKSAGGRTDHPFQSLGLFRWYFGASPFCQCLCLSPFIDRKDGPQIIRLPRRVWICLWLEVRMRWDINQKAYKSSACFLSLSSLPFCFDLPSVLFLLPFFVSLLILSFCSPGVQVLFPPFKCVFEYLVHLAKRSQQQHVWDTQEKEMEGCIYTYVKGRRRTVTCRQEEQGKKRGRRLWSLATFKFDMLFSLPWRVFHFCSLASRSCFSVMSGVCALSFPFSCCRCCFHRSPSSFWLERLSPFSNLVLSSCTLKDLFGKEDQYFPPFLCSSVWRRRPSFFSLSLLLSQPSFPAVGSWRCQVRVIHHLHIENHWQVRITATNGITHRSGS